MALTKTRTAIWAATTLTAGAANTDSGWIDVSAGYRMGVNVKITCGATGPTVEAQVQVQVAADAAGTNAINLGAALIASKSNAAVTPWSIALPDWIGAFKLIAGSNTAQNVTIDADYARILTL